jgi:sarcosine oxidase subunit alpha
MPRVQPPRDPVTLQFDGRSVLAERGEPVAVALVAAGHLALARSAKFHRPRGPACLRAACDGCLARVDDVPNVMTCRVPAAEGMRIETQNVVGSREVDLLRMADWFFPEGMNHHELFAGVPGVQRVMQAFARRVAGLGKLPRMSEHEAKANDASAPREPLTREARRREVDVLVVGAGPAGMMTALDLSQRGRRVEVIDDDLVWGGSVRALPATSSAARAWKPMLDAFADAAVMSRLQVRMMTTAAGIYGDDVLVASGATDDGVEVVTARTLVLAPGAHDGVLAFEGNDVPGILSARAGGWLASRGVSLGERVVVVVAPGDGSGPFGEAYAEAHPGCTLVEGLPVRVRGSSRVKEVTVSTVSGDKRLPCDALLVDAPRAPAYELCAQAGAARAPEPRGHGHPARGGRHLARGRRGDAAGLSAPLSPRRGPRT